MSNNKVGIPGRLEEEVRKIGSPTAVANLIHVGKSTVYYWFEKGNITAEHLAQLAVLGLDVGYVLSGIRTGASEVNSMLSPVPSYRVRASAGPGNQVYDEEVDQTFAFRKDWLQQKGLVPEQLSVIHVEGDSMNPRLHDGDMVLINHADTEIKSGKAYVVRINDELLVKFLQRLPGDQVQLSSANQDYPPFIVDENSQIEVIGRVVCSSHEW